MQLRIVYTGRNYDAAGRFPSTLELAADASLHDALEAIRRSLADPRQLPPTCLVAVSGIHQGTVAKHRNAALHDGDELLLVAPVAGG